MRAEDKKWLVDMYDAYNRAFDKARREGKDTNLIAPTLYLLMNILNHFKIDYEEAKK